MQGLSMFHPQKLLSPMPTYDYLCDSCSHEFEEFQYIKDDPLTKCPKCGKKKLRRLIGGGAAIVFRGSGFYQTDYRSDSYRKAAKAESAPKTESTSPCKECAAAKECKAKS
jgi:putative FmdB family regulatory protein